MAQAGSGYGPGPDILGAMLNRIVENLGLRLSICVAVLIAVAAIVATATSNIIRTSSSSQFVVLANVQDGDLEIYVQVPSRALRSIFNAKTDRFATERGLVNYASMRDGTWQHADEVFGSLRAFGDMQSSGQQVLNLESMSFMLHPPQPRFELTDPLSAGIAVSVCGPAQRQIKVPLRDTITYAGFYVSGIETRINRDVVNLVFPATGRDPLQLKSVSSRTTASFAACVKSWPTGTIGAADPVQECGRRDGHASCRSSITNACTCLSGATRSPADQWL